MGREQLCCSLPPEVYSLRIRACHCVQAAIVWLLVLQGQLNLMEA